MTNLEAIEQFKYAIDLIKQEGKDYLDKRDIPMLSIAIEALENQKTLQEELEKIYEEVEAVKLTASKISNGYECYGVENKTAKEMRTEILDIIYEHIKENKEK